ncbi:uncharacterized protein IL334_003818 [Kwoniella shivajii]|uniref:PWI domain-containing protein n=1 Tax=Kwoniella shivajii TaxID=564305 RepID=A0ABZ1CYZ1_9TREE|nr:hypothetical protein IL334_003818 [Kwoniella shivajii]
MRGTNAAQDSRFKDKEAASIKATKFPKHFSEKVDLRKVNLSVLRPWIASKVTELIKIEDDVVVEYVFGMLEDKEKPIPDPKKMQISLVGFMDKHGAAAFMDSLWSLLLSAQNTVGGVPAEFIEAKKKELQAKQAEEKRIQDTRNIGRSQAEDTFDRRRGDNALPSRPGPPPRRSPPRGGRDEYRPRDRGDEYRPRPPRRDFDRERDNGYGQRRGGGYDRPRSRSRSPEGGGGGGGGGMARGGGYRRRSPSPRRRSPSPPSRATRRDSPPVRRRRSPSPSTRRRSPSPSTRRRERSITPLKKKRDDTPPISSIARSPRGEKREKGRARSRSRTPTPSDPGTNSRSRSPTVTPPRRRRRSPSDSRSRSPRGDDIHKKGRGRFTVEDGKEEKKGKSRWD